MDMQTHRFMFDNVLDETADNETVYQFTGQPLINRLFQGFTVTLFAYG